jgi:hypothetical protein
MATVTLTPKTTIHTLLKEYPFLLEFLTAYGPEFRKLTNPCDSTARANASSRAAPP